MNKISKVDRPDSGTSTLKPISFPTISLLQVSNTSTSTHNQTISRYSELLPSDKHEIKCISGAQPDLFQYNDRCPLFLSSDQEQTQQNRNTKIGRDKKLKLINQSIQKNKDSIIIKQISQKSQQKRYKGKPNEKQINSSQNINKNLIQEKSQLKSKENVLKLVQVQCDKKDTQSKQMKKQVQQMIIKQSTKKQKQVSKTIPQIIKQNIAAKQKLVKQLEISITQQSMSKSIQPNHQYSNNTTKTEQIVLQKSIIKINNMNKSDQKHIPKSPSMKYSIKNNKNQILQQYDYAIQQHSNEQTQKSKQKPSLPPQLQITDKKQHNIQLNLSTLRQKQIELNSNTSQIINQAKYYQNNENVQIQQIQTQRFSKDYGDFKKNHSLREEFNKNDETPVKRKRNKIFGASSIRNKSTYRELTPSRSVQVNTFEYPSKIIDKKQQDNDKQRDFFPQIKALNVLDKIVDQLSHSNVQSTYNFPTQRSNQELLKFKSRAQDFILKISKITLLQECLEEQLLKQRQNIGQFFKLHKKLMDNYKFLLKRSKKKFSSFVVQLIEVHEQFMTINSTLAYYCQIKNILLELQNKIKLFYILMDRQQYKKFNVIEKMKATRLNLGDNRLEKKFYQYLTNEIRQLSEVEIQNRQKLQIKLNKNIIK